MKRPNVPAEAAAASTLTCDGSSGCLDQSGQQGDPVVEAEAQVAGVDLDSEPLYHEDAGQDGEYDGDSRKLFGVVSYLAFAGYLRNVLDSCCHMAVRRLFRRRGWRG